MDNATTSSLVADSKAPTVAPSYRSLSEVEKASVENLRQQPDDAVSEASEEQQQQQPAEENEKGNELTLHATAASHAGGASVRQVATRDDGTEYPTGVKFGLIMLALCLSVFLVALGKPSASSSCARYVVSTPREHCRLIPRP